MAYDKTRFAYPMALDEVASRWHPGGERQGKAFAAQRDPRAGDCSSAAPDGSPPSDHRLDALSTSSWEAGSRSCAAALSEPRPAAYLEVRTPSRAVALELPGWARLAGHEVVGEAAASDATVVQVRRGRTARVLAAPLPSGATRRRSARRELHTAIGEAAGRPRASNPGRDSRRSARSPRRPCPATGGA